MWKGKKPNPEVRQMEANPERISSPNFFHRLMEFGQF
jgi:hypothetical protein